MFTAIARNLRLVSAPQIVQAAPLHSVPAHHTLEDAYATRQLRRQWQSDPCRAKRPANASSVRQCCAAATDALVAEWYLVIDQIKVGAIPNDRMKAGVDCSRNRCRVPGVQERCLVERWRNRLTRRASRATAAVTGARRGNSRRWPYLKPRIDKDEVREAKLWDADGHHNTSTKRRSGAQFVANFKFNFLRVAQQHTLGIVGYIVGFCLQFTPVSEGERILKIG